MLVVAFSDQGIPVGFMGIDGTRLEMLFLSPDVRGTGLGRQLLQRGIRRYGVTSLCVNEQNPQALDFYLHMGFQVRSRTGDRRAGQSLPSPLHVPAGIGASLAPFFPPCYTEGSTIMERRYPAMINTTLCYIRQGGQCLMLHRVKKENDLNQGKWIGIGGKFEDGESPEDCMFREVNEETGLTPAEYRYRGLVTFVSDRWPTEYMHLFTIDRFTRNPEGRLPGGRPGVAALDTAVHHPPLGGDEIFLRLIEEDVPFFSLKLRYRGTYWKRLSLNGRHVKGGPQL